MRITPVFSFIASLFAPLLFAQGYDSLVRHDLGAPTNLAPFATATTTDGGLWLLGSDNYNQHQLVRLDASGNRTAGLFLPGELDSDNADRFTLYPLADGGVLELDTHRLSQFENACILRSVTRDGVLRFEHKVRQPSCSLRMAKPGGAPYLLKNIEGATVLSEDGALASRFELTGDTSLVRAEFIGEHDLVFLRTNETRTGYVLSRATQAGAQLWSNPLENVRFNQNVTVRGLNDGRTLVIVSDTSKLLMRFYSATGGLTETREIIMPEATQASFGDWSADGLGNLALSLRFEIDSSDISYGAILFAPNATVLKQMRYAIGDRCTRECRLLGLVQGFANALGTPTGGKLVLTSLSPNVANTEVALPASFHARISNSNNATILMTSDANFRAFNASGVEIAKPSMLGKGITYPVILATTIANDGKSFVLQQVYDGQYTNQLQAFDANGAKLWQRSNLDASGPRLWANGARICLMGSQVLNNSTTLVCFANSTGTELATTVIPDASFIGAFPPKIGSRLLANGTLRVARITGGSLEVIDIANDNLISKLIIPIANVKSINDIGATGSFLLTAAVPGPPNVSEWVALNAMGQIAFRRAIPGNSFGVEFGRMLENDDALLIKSTQNSSAVVFETTLLSQNGTQRWSVSNARISQDDYPSNLLFDAKNAYLMRRVRGMLRLKALSLNDGTSVWNQELKTDRFSDVDIYTAANANALSVSVEVPLGVHLSQISSVNGAVLQQRLLDCAAAECGSYATALDSAGNFRSISIAQDPGRAAIALGRTDTRTSALQVAVDQPGLSGAWYTPQLNGQGFFVEYFPQSKLLFAPWFTFAAVDQQSSGEAADFDSVGTLRWYTLSGVVEPGAKVAQLEIRRNNAGVFDSAPITESTVVGTATLRAQDCNRATLEFEFINSEALGKYGVLPLERLTGGSAPCQLSNGQTQPGRDSRPAFGGFDGRQSGSWYQPTTSGQGLMMTVQPATASAPGFFFGGWFTYDAGKPNDPTSKHWLTLSGEIPVNAQPGVVPVAIYRTLGGQLSAVPTQNNTIVGHGTVTFSGCDVAVLRYQFDDAPIVGAFKARSGQINLSRLGACPAQ